LILDRAAIVKIYGTVPEDDLIKMAELVGGK
jgi:hypothetical protein